MTTKIEWTDETWNPVVGCSRISAGCLNCYANTAANSPRLQQFNQYQETKDWNGKLIFVPSQLDKPLHWKRSKKIFVCSMSDFFHDNFLPEWREEIMGIIKQCPQHTFQILTKRHIPENYIFPANVWVGVTVENNQSLHRIENLQRVEATVKFVSFEPLLEPIKMVNLKGINWAIIGGESGVGARQCQVQDISSLVWQCRNFKVKVFLKQLGDNCWDGQVKIKAGSKGKAIEAWPPGFKALREFPV